MEFAMKFPDNSGKTSSANKNSPPEIRDAVLVIRELT
jgi:hypothetical protein